MFWTFDVCMKLMLWPAMLQLAQLKGLCRYNRQQIVVIPPPTVPPQPPETTIGIIDASTFPTVPPGTDACVDCTTATPIPPTVPPEPSTFPTVPPTQPPEPSTFPTAPPTEPPTIPTAPPEPSTFPTAPPTEPPTIPTAPPEPSTFPTAPPTEPPTIPTAPPEPSTFPTAPPTEPPTIPTVPPEPSTFPTVPPTETPEPSTFPTVPPVTPTVPPTQPATPPVIGVSTFPTVSPGTDSCPDCTTATGAPVTEPPATITFPPDPPRTEPPVTEPPATITFPPDPSSAGPPATSGPILSASSFATEAPGTNSCPDCETSTPAHTTSEPEFPMPTITPNPNPVPSFPTIIASSFPTVPPGDEACIDCSTADSDIDERRPLLRFQKSQTPEHVFRPIVFPGEASIQNPGKNARVPRRHKSFIAEKSTYNELPLSTGDLPSCSTPEGRQGACVNIRKCLPLLRILQVAAREPDAANYLRNSLCGYEGTDPMVCCALVIDPRPSPTSEPIRSNLPTPATGCGYTNASHPKVVGGTPAALDSWPWMALLGYQRTEGVATKFLCGGTLITDRHVVTAAHCVFNRDDLVLVRLGELDILSDFDGAHPIDIPIAERIMHEEYNPKSSTNDIAILRLASPAPISHSIKPICLPLTGQLRSKDYVREFPFVAGWGKVKFGGPSSTTLQELQIPVVSNAQCKENYAMFKAQVIDERVLCAGYAQGGKDACQGDSGGPLMYPVLNDARDAYNYYLIGVVSYGYKCAEPGYPGVYTRVTQFIPWIESKVR